MSNRTDYLTYLANQGYTPVRAVTFEEGTGTPVEHYTAVSLVVVGTPTWTTDGTYGTAIRYDATSDGHKLAGASNGWLGTSSNTALLIRKKADTTLRQQATFAVDTIFGTPQYKAHLPYDDGIVYFDFGGTSGNNRTTYSYTATTNVEAWAFRAGPSGISIWKDGVSVASNATAISRAGDTGLMFINNGPFLSGDIQDLFFLAFVNGEVSDAVLATFTASQVLLGFSPTITNATLESGHVGDAYTDTIDVSGGSSPFVYTISAGALPAGLSLSASTGTISGTPTEAGFADFTILVTGSNAATTSQAYRLFIDSDSCVANSLGSLLYGSWANNSRVGPFENGARTFASIFKDYSVGTKLLANYSTDSGLTWTEVRTSALTNSIVSFDAHQDPADTDTIHVAVQESTSGRVSYFTFDMVTGTWTLESETVKASNTIITGAVSMTVLSGGDPMIAFETDKESVSAAYYNRIGVKRRTSGTWGSEYAMGDVGIAQSNLFGRLVAGLENRAHMFYAQSPGTFVVSTNDLGRQIIMSDGSLSATFIYRYTGLLGPIPTFHIGDYTTYDSGSDFILAIPIKWGGSPSIDLFIDSDTVGNAFQTIVLDYFVGEAASAFVPIVTRYVGGSLKTLDWAWPSLSSTSAIRYKDDNTPSGMDNQAGPEMGDIASVTQIMDGNIVQRTCDGVTSTYIMTAAYLGTVDAVTNTIKFEWIKVDDLPTDSSLDIDTWLDELADQEVAFCCTPTAASSDAFRTVEILRGSMLEGDLFVADLLGANAAVDTPTIFTQEVADVLKLSMIPPPNAVKGMDYIYVPQPTTLATPSDSTATVPIPEDFAPFLKFGLLADLFNKSGETHDPMRAAICQDLFDLGIEVARTWVSGNSV